MAVKQASEKTVGNHHQQLINGQTEKKKEQDINKNENINRTKHQKRKDGCEQCFM